jgi:hypothetical protein
MARSLNYARATVSSFRAEPCTASRNSIRRSTDRFPCLAPALIGRRYFDELAAVVNAPGKPDRELARMRPHLQGRNLSPYSRPRSPTAPAAYLIRHLAGRIKIGLYYVRGEGGLVLSMSLSRELNNVVLCRSCSRCGSERRNPGIWFRSIRHYTCATCGGTEVLTYDEKLKLFARAQAMRLAAG